MVYCTYAACFFLLDIVYVDIYKLSIFDCFIVFSHMNQPYLMFPFHLVIDFRSLQSCHSEDLSLCMCNGVIISLGYVHRSRSHVHFHSTRFCQNVLQSGYTKFIFPPLFHILPTSAVRFF